MRDGMHVAKSRGVLTEQDMRCIRYRLSCDTTERRHLDDAAGTDTVVDVQTHPGIQMRRPIESTHADVIGIAGEVLHFLTAGKARIGNLHDEPQARLSPPVRDVDHALGLSGRTHDRLSYASQVTGLDVMTALGCFLHGGNHVARHVCVIGPECHVVVGTSFHKQQAGNVHLRCVPC